MTDNKHKFGDLIMTQGTASYFQSDSDFEKRFSSSKLNDTDNQTLYYIMVQIW